MDAYWTRNGEKLKEDSRISIACLLRQYTLTIRDCRADDSGEVAFVAGDCKTSTRFTVTGEEESEMLITNQNQITNVSMLECII